MKFLRILPEGYTAVHHFKMFDINGGQLLFGFVPHTHPLRWMAKTIKAPRTFGFEVCVSKYNAVVIWRRDV